MEVSFISIASSRSSSSRARAFTVAGCFLSACARAAASSMISSALSGKKRSVRYLTLKSTAISAIC